MPIVPNPTQLEIIRAMESVMVPLPERSIIEFCCRDEEKKGKAIRQSKRYEKYHAAFMRMRRTKLILESPTQKGLYYLTKYRLTPQNTLVDESSPQSEDQQPQIPSQTISQFLTGLCSTSSSKAIVVTTQESEKESNTFIQKNPIALVKHLPEDVRVTRKRRLSGLPWEEQVKRAKAYEIIILPPPKQPGYYTFPEVEKILEDYKWQFGLNPTQFQEMYAITLNMPFEYIRVKGKRIEERAVTTQLFRTFCTMLVMYKRTNTSPYRIYTKENLEQNVRMSSEMEYFYKTYAFLRPDHVGVNIRELNQMMAAAFRTSPEYVEAYAIYQLYRGLCAKVQEHMAKQDNTVLLEPKPRSATITKLPPRKK